MKGIRQGVVYSLVSKTGEDPFYHTFKMSFYSYFKHNAEAIVNFNEWIKEKTKEWIIPLFEV